MRKLALPVLAASLAACLASARIEARVTDEEVEAAIGAGVAQLLKSQNPDGSWSEGGSIHVWNYVYSGGAEVCAMLGLAYAGADVKDPKVLKGIEKLIQYPMYRTYTTSLRILVLQKLLPRLRRELAERARQVLKQDTAFLIKHQGEHGGWTYPAADYGSLKAVPPSPIYDFSNTQMALLGLSEAIHSGLELPLSVMKKAQDLYLKRQEDDGGWSYGAFVPTQKVRNASYGAMTAAAVASLFITRDYLYRGVGCPCRGGSSSGRVPPQVEKAIEAGLDWLGKYFTGTGHPSALPDDASLDSNTIYWLYACERVGLASGMKYFGGHDWYDEGAAFIIQRQRPEGDWGRVWNTAFAISFLAKGRAPILMNKLRFDGQWNSHMRDLAHLTGYLAMKKEQPIRWQIINLDAAVDEWHDSPILYITAESPLKLSDEEKRKLRQFTDSGGTILFEASCGNRAAAGAWQLLAKELWPEWEMTRLEKDHPLFVADQDMSRGRVPALFGMSDGIRTFAVVSLTDISCPWNTNAVARNEPLFILGGNLYAYATDRRPIRARLAHAKPATRAAYAEAALSAGPRTSLKVVRVKHGGDWYVGRNYDPVGRLAAALGEKAPIKIAQGEPADPSAMAPAQAQVAHLTGRQGVRLGEAEAAALKAYLQGGGFLLAEAAMGDARFDAEFRPLAAQLGLQFNVLEASDPLITGRLSAASGYNVSEVSYKYHLRAERIGKPTPLVYGLYLGGRLVGVYSPFDLSYAQTGFDAWGCRGVEADDARAILTNILLLASCM